MSDQEFWKRYTIVVKRIKQEVLDASAGEEAAEESSLTDSVIISRQESGLEALREAVSQDGVSNFYLFESGWLLQFLPVRVRMASPISACSSQDGFSNFYLFDSGWLFQFLPVPLSPRSIFRIGLRRLRMDKFSRIKEVEDSWTLGSVNLKEEHTKMAVSAHERGL
jgi:hypothetical protein